jgi:DNA invertase Pin-like site-specific DNA recombinase
MAIIGYARVSTLEQNLNLQIDSLKLMGADKIFTDKVSSGSDKRPGLARLLSQLREGDTIVVWRLDRLARNLKQLLDLVQRFQEMRVSFKSITEAIDSTTAQGKLFLSVFGALAEFEKNLIRERTMAGLKSARARGRIGGRPTVLNSEKIKEVHRLFHKKRLHSEEVARVVGISRSSVYAALKTTASIRTPFMDKSL